MARNFNGGSSQYVSTTTVPITAAPFTVSIWALCGNNTSAFRLFSLFNNASASTTGDYFSILARGDLAGDPISMAVATSNVVTRTDTTSGFSANTWFHAAMVVASATNRSVYLNGGSKATSTISRAPSGVNEMGSGVDYVLGRVYNSATCRVAHAAVYDDALDDAEIVSLAKAWHPYFVRRKSLKAYYPFGGHMGRNDNDFASGVYDMTAVNTPAFVDDGRIIHPPPMLMPSRVVFAGGVAKPVLFHSHYMSQGMRP